MKTFKLWLENKELPKELSAKQIKNIVKLNDHKYKLYASAKGNDSELLKLKYQEAEKDGLLKDILKNGIKNPIEIKIDDNGNQTLIKGHHRLAIALKHFPKRLIQINYTKENNTWFKPDLSEEKNELIRQANTLNIKKENIFQAFQNGKLQTISQSIWNKMENTNSNDKKLTWNQINSWENKDVKNIKNALKEKYPLPAPIVLKYKNKYYCVAGNTRLSMSKLLNVTPKVWMIDI
jgi:hypothetical protein